VINPEIHFTFTPEILSFAENLLSHFSLEQYIIEASQKAKNSQGEKKIKTIQILAQIIYEAIQFWKVVP